jgi:hypothetical protein
LALVASDDDYDDDDGCLRDDCCCFAVVRHYGYEEVNDAKYATISGK